MKKAEIIERLRGLQRMAMAVAKTIRAEKPESSYFWFKEAELMREAAEAIQDKQGAEPETEGGGSSWWTVCGACHGAIDQDDAYCRHCGTPVLKAGGKL